MSELRKQLFVIGQGFIGRALVARACGRPQTFAPPMVHCRRPEQADHRSGVQFVADLENVTFGTVDLVVEAAHPDITRRHGVRILASADYLPLSTSALTDDALLTSLLEAAEAAGTRLFLPAGALIGGEELVKRTVPWTRVRVTFRKNPANIDFSETGIDPAGLQAPTTVFEGPVREIAARYPRNVNTMVTAALLSTGVDACEGVLVADPALDCAVAEVEAWGEDGSYFRTEKRQPAVGVSGTEMADSAWHSVLGALGLSDGPLHLV